jgi:hypothetical protein
LTCSCPLVGDYSRAACHHARYLDAVFDCATLIGDWFASASNRAIEIGERRLVQRAPD